MNIHTSCSKQLLTGVNDLRPTPAEHVIAPYGAVGVTGVHGLYYRVEYTVNQKARIQ